MTTMQLCWAGCLLVGLAWAIMRLDRLDRGCAAHAGALVIALAIVAKAGLIALLVCGYVYLSRVYRDVRDGSYPK